MMKLVSLRSRHNATIHLGYLGMGFDNMKLFHFVSLCNYVSLLFHLASCLYVFPWICRWEPHMCPIWALCRPCLSEVLHKEEQQQSGLRRLLQLIETITLQDLLKAGSSASSMWIHVYARNCTYIRRPDDLKSIKMTKLDLYRTRRLWEILHMLWRAAYHLPLHAAKRRWPSWCWGPSADLFCIAFRTGSLYVPWVFWSY